MIPFFFWWPLWSAFRGQEMSLKQITWNKKKVKRTSKDKKDLSSMWLKNHIVFSPPKNIKMARELAKKNRVQTSTYDTHHVTLGKSPNLSMPQEIKATGRKYFSTLFQLSLFWTLIYVYYIYMYIYISNCSYHSI